MTADFVVSLYTYPWDLTQEGLDLSLGRISDVARCDEVLLTPCYHRSDYFRPHNPRPIYFGENGAVYFQPQIERYAATSIRPRVSREVTDEGYFDRIVEAIERRGLQFSAWMVYTYQNYLSEQYPEFAKHDAFGTPYVGQLSTMPNDVRQYFVALTKEVVERYRPDAVWVESLMRRRFPMPGKRRADISPRCQFLLGLCFNPASMAVAEAAGLDASALRQDVVDWLRPRLASGSSGDDEPVTDPWLAEMFDGRLQRYLEIAQQHTRVLWDDVTGVIHRAGARVQSNLAVASQASYTDLHPDINRHIDRLGLTPAADTGAADIAALTQQIAPGGTVFFRSVADLDSIPSIADELEAGQRAGAGGITYYNYGLLTEAQLRNIGIAVAETVKSA